MEERIWHKHYSDKVPTSLDYEKLTLPEVLDRTVNKYPNSVALNMMGKKITYRELGYLVDRFATALADLGVKKGDRIALIMPNMPQMPVAAYAVFRLGAVVVMNNPLYTERELEYQLNDSGCTVCVCMDLLVPRIQKLQQTTGIKTIIAAHIRDYLPFPAKQLFPFIKKGMHRKTDPNEGVHDFMDLVKKYPPKPPQTTVEWDDMAALLYTGGTTGVSKGVILKHRNCSSVIQLMKAWIYDPEEGKDSIIAIFPFFHIAGFTAMMNHSILRGIEQILVPRPDPQTVLDMSKKYKPDWFGCVPTMYVGLLNHPNLPPKPELKFIKGSVSGAAPLAMETLKHWEDRVGAQIIEVYGMTEMSPISHANPWGGKTKAGSVGIPFPDTDCRIVDVETGEKDMPPGEAGEIILKGPQQMQGYYKRPDETADSLRDGWFYTGDIGYMDEDGYLFVVDRKKDMIIAGGFNIYPRDIDEILYEHPKMSRSLHHRPARCLSRGNGQGVCSASTRADHDRRGYHGFCREKLAAYKVPKMVEFIGRSAQKRHWQGFAPRTTRNGRKKTSSPDQLTKFQAISKMGHRTFWDGLDSTGEGK
jgi:long-chain acyl-CoA synthetase